MSNRSSYSKSNYKKNLICSVCLCSRSSQLFSTNYCCSRIKKHSKRQICDSCLHQHIISKLYSCLTSCVICPEINCVANLSQTAICDVLLKYKSIDLLNDYLHEQQWEGKSDEWIERFAVRCPGCNVPIEKDGGCDEMICIRCQKHFYWSKAKRYFYQSRYRLFYIIHPFVDGIILVISLLFLILATVIYFKK